MINIKETQKWYAKERGIKIEEFDDYDAHVCRVANAYGNVVEKLTIPLVGSRRELLITFFMHFRNKGEQNIGMTIEQFVDDFLSN